MEGERTSEAVVIPDISEPLTNETEEHGTLSSEQHHPVAPIAVPVASVPVSLPVGVDLIGVASAGATFNVITPDQLQLSSGGHYKPVLCVDNSFICDARNDKDAETIRTWVRNAQNGWEKATHIVIQGEPLVSSAEVSPASGAVTGSTTPGTTLNSPTTWNESVHLPVLPVRCKNTSAELHKAKFGSGGRGRCIKLGDNWYTPSEFEAICGRASSKDWKRSIRFGGRSLQTLVDEAILTPHATSCTCSACCDDDTATGPVRLFTPYKRRKRKNTDEGSHKMKRSSSKDNSNDEGSESDVRGAGDDWDNSPLDQRSPSGGNGGGVSQSSQLPVTTSPPSTFSKSQLSDIMVVTTASSDLVTQSSSAVSNGSRLAPSPSQGGTTSSQRTDANQSGDSISAVTAKHSEVFKRLEEMAAKILKMSYQFRSAIEEAKDHFQSEIDKLKKESEQAILTARVEAQAAREALEQRAEHVQVVDSLDTVDLHPSTDSEAKKCANCNRDALAECSLCRRTPYCSTFCQRKDWSSHQMECVRAVTTVATTADHAGNIMLIVKSTDQVLTSDNITHSDG